MGLDMFLVRVERVPDWSVADYEAYFEVVWGCEREPGVPLRSTVVRRVGQYLTMRQVPEAIRNRMVAALAQRPPLIGEAIPPYDEIGYWRKANAIHRWFVQQVQEGVDECQWSMVTRDHLQALHARVRQVLAHPDEAPRVLPTQAGFFFGSTAYDEWYFSDLRETDEIVSRALKMPEEDYCILYRASW